MPQLTGAEGDDLGASDELIPFKDEGEREDKPNRAAERDLDDVKSSLVNESESGSDSEADRRPRINPHLETRTRHTLFEEASRRQQDPAGLFQPAPYVGYPFFMIPDLGNLCGPYLSNGALTPGARTYLPFQWPLLDVPGRSIRDSAAPAHLSNPVGHMTHLHPLLSYSPEAFSPQRASPGFSPDTAGVSRSPCYPVSPGGMAQIPHLGWLQGQTMYPITGGFSPAALAMNASMSSLVSGSFSPRLVPPPQSPLPHPAGPPTVKQEEAAACSSQPGRSAQHTEDEKKKPHIKKPLNAFMLYMREERPLVVAQCKVKESATINQILGQRWHSLSKEEQSKYYDLARKERLLHSKLYPGWSARDNYGKKKKRKRAKSETQFEDPGEDFPLQLKRPRDETPHTHPQRTHSEHTHPQRTHSEHTHSQLTPNTHTHSQLTQNTHTHSQLTQNTHTHLQLTHSEHTHLQLTQNTHAARSHTVSHLTHTHLSQASPASSLDSPATPTTALASPAAPAPTHTEHTHTHSSHTCAYGEQLQPLSLTTRPHRTSGAGPVRRSVTPGPSTPSSSCDTPSPHTAPSRCSPPPFLAPPPTSLGAFASVRRANQL